MVSAQESAFVCCRASFIDGTADAGHDIVISPISLAEIVYLVEKNRLAVSAYQDLKKALTDPEYVIQESPHHRGHSYVCWSADHQP